MRLNILVLHGVRNFQAAFRSSLDYVLCFERYAPNHNYIYCCILDTITPAVRDLEVHGVIVDSTALASIRMRPRAFYDTCRTNWSFLREWDAAKIVFPQDDYHDSELLDATFSDWRVDKVCTVIPTSHQLLYPRTSKTADVEIVLTGYVDDNSISSFEQFRLPFARREIDLGQRVTMYPAIGGRYAQLKGRLANVLAEEAQAAGFKVDVSTRDEDRISGDAWLKFLGNCKFVSGAEGGVSIWDPTGKIRTAIGNFLEKNNGASFEEIEVACFAGLDGQHQFSAISPRLFEAALMGCSQILLEGRYLPEIEPLTHYIPVLQDLSDAKEAVREMRDLEAGARRAAAMYEALILTDKYRYSTLAKATICEIAQIASRRHVAGCSTDEFKRVRAAHEQALEKARTSPSAGPYPTAAMNFLYKYFRHAVPRPLRHAVLRWLEWR